jgi:RHS repeat-associated protein
VGSISAPGRGRERYVPGAGTISLNTTTIGAVKQSATPSGYLNGTIDEAAYYPSALDAAAIARHAYNGTNAQPEVATYTYNGDGTRTTKTVDGTKTQFTWDTAGGLPLLASYGTTQYIYGLDGAPLEQVNISNSTVVYYHQDQQNSTRALTDTSGNLLTTYTTDAFGNPTTSSGSTLTPLRYDGEYRDNETGFVYLRARYYDPSTAQFLSRDRAVEETRSAYGYARSDPLNGEDPSGLLVGRHDPWPVHADPGPPQTFSCAPPIDSNYLASASGSSNVITCASGPILHGSLRSGSTPEQARAEAEASGYEIPANYIAQQASNLRGWIFRAPGTEGPASTVRVGEANWQNPNGYVRYTNERGEYTNELGGPDGLPPEDTHLPLRGDPEDPLDPVMFESFTRC